MRVNDCVVAGGTPARAVVLVRNHRTAVGGGPTRRRSATGPCPGATSTTSAARPGPERHFLPHGEAVPLVEGQVAAVARLQKHRPPVRVRLPQQPAEHLGPAPRAARIRVGSDVLDVPVRGVGRVAVLQREQPHCGPGQLGPARPQERARVAQQIAHRQLPLPGLRPHRRHRAVRIGPHPARRDLLRQMRGEQQPQPPVPVVRHQPGPDGVLGVGTGEHGGERRDVGDGSADYVGHGRGG